MSSNPIVISAKKLSKVYKLYKSPQHRLKEALHPARKKYHKDFYALKNVNLEIRKGEVIGIIGRNGSGKSTLLKILSKVLTPTRGEFMVQGKISSLLELGSGFNPELTGIENIFFYGTVLGFSEEKINNKLQEIIDFADIGEFIYQPLKTYSSGMKSRLAFSVAIHVDPDVLILDEVLAVGDELFQRKCYARMENFFKSGITTLYVSHTIPVINQICSRVLLMHNGQNILDGPPRLVTMYYQKLLYARGENIQAVLNEINEINKDPFVKEQMHSGMPVSTQKTEKEADTTTYAFKKDQKDRDLLQPYYIKEFRPKSTVLQNPHNITLSDIFIKTRDGEVVNQLVSGENYWIHFNFRFNNAFERINVGVDFKDEKGKNFSGLSLRYSDLVIPKVGVGDIVKCAWKFRCLFTKGTYYVDIGMNEAGKTKKEFILKCDDAINFKIIENRDQPFNVWGIIDMDIEPKVIHIKAGE